MIGLDTYLTGWAKQYQKGARGAGEEANVVPSRCVLAIFWHNSSKESVVARGGLCVSQARMEE